MPRIPTYTAPAGGSQVPQTPDIIPFHQMPNIGGAVTQLGQAVQQISGRLNDQQSDLEYLSMKGDYEAGVLTIRTELDRNPATHESPEAYSDMFQERTQTLVEDIASSGKSKNGPAMFGRYVRQKYPMDQAQAGAQGARLFTANQAILLDTAEEQMVRQAVAAPTIEEKQMVRTEHMQAVSDAAARGIIAPALAAKKMQDFGPKVEEGTMRALAFSDPHKLQEMNRAGMFPNVPLEKKGVILENAFNLYEKDVRRFERVAQQQEDDLYFVLLRRALEGTLPTSLIEDGAAGKSIIKDPRKWETLKQTNEKVAGNKGGLQLRIIQQEYKRTNATQADIDNARTAVDRLVADIGGGNEDVIKFLDELQSDHFRARNTAAAERGEARTIERGERVEERADVADARAREAQGRAQRNEAERRTATSINEALTSYRAQVGPLTKQQIRNERHRRQELDRRNVEEDAIRDMVRNKGVSPKDAVDSVMSKRKTIQQSVPNSLPVAPGVPRSNKDVLIEDALKNLGR